MYELSINRGVSKRYMKTLGSELDYGCDFTPWLLKVNDTIASFTVEFETGSPLTLIDQTTDGFVAVAWIGIPDDETLLNKTLLAHYHIVTNSTPPRKDTRTVAFYIVAR